MTEQESPTSLESPQTMSGASTVDERPETGVPGVDAVLAEVDTIDALPLEEHLAAFEQAHASLRAALDAQPSQQPVEQPIEQPGAPSAGPAGGPV
jgi:hypothetical protein